MAYQNGAKQAITRRICEMGTIKIEPSLRDAKYGRTGVGEKIVLSAARNVRPFSSEEKRNELFTGNWVLCRVRKCLPSFFSRKPSPLPELCESRRKLRVKMKYAFSYSARPSSITRRNNRAFSISFHLPHRVSPAVNQIFSSQSGGAVGMGGTHISWFNPRFRAFAEK